MTNIRSHDLVLCNSSRGYIWVKSRHGHGKELITTYKPITVKPMKILGHGDGTQLTKSDETLLLDNGTLPSQHA